MIGKEKKAALEEKLRLLRSVTKSSAGNNKTSILVDASKYIKELKGKVEAAAAASSQPADSTTASLSGSTTAMAAATVSVSSVELDSSISSSNRRGFRINVSLERTRPGLLVSVLEAFEDLGLDVLDADVSCADAAAFRLQALGSSGLQGRQAGDESVDEQMVRQAVLKAIAKCMGGDDE